MKDYLLITHDFPPKTGGVARYLSRLSRYLGDRVLVISSEEGNDLDNSYAFEQRTLLSTVLWPAWFKTVFILLAKHDAARTVLVSHVLPFGTAAYVSAWFTKRPYEVIVHGMDIGLAQKSMLKKLIAGHVLRSAKRVICNSKHLEHEIRNVFGVQQTKVVYPCLEPQDFYQPTNGTSATVRLLTVARLVQRKGHLRVLAALQTLLQDGLNVHYTIIGSGQEEATIRAYVREQGLEDSVEIMTYASDVDVTNAYQHADLFVMPTHYQAEDREGFGFVYLEAAQFGVPSIATDHPGVDEAVLHEETGLLVPDGDQEALVEVLKRLCVDESLRHIYGERAKERVDQVFTCKQQFSVFDV